MACGVVDMGWNVDVWVRSEKRREEKRRECVNCD